MTMTMLFFFFFLQKQVVYHHEVLDCQIDGDNDDGGRGSFATILHLPPTTFPSPGDYALTLYPSLIDFVGRTWLVPGSGGVHGGGRGGLSMAPACASSYSFSVSCLREGTTAGSGGSGGAGPVGH